jgi:hypothetical protein
MSLARVATGMVLLIDLVLFLARSYVVCAVKIMVWGCADREMVTVVVSTDDFEFAFDADAITVPVPVPMPMPMSVPDMVCPSLVDDVLLTVGLSGNDSNCCARAIID